MERLVDCPITQTLFILYAFKSLLLEEGVNVVIFYFCLLLPVLYDVSFPVLLMFVLKQ